MKRTYAIVSDRNRSVDYNNKETLTPLQGIVSPINLGVDYNDKVEILCYFTIVSFIKKEVDYNKYILKTEERL